MSSDLILELLGELLANFIKKSHTIPALPELESLCLGHYSILQLLS